MDKIVMDSVQKLEDASLECASGGLGTGWGLIVAGVSIVGASIFTNLGCSIASTVCQYQAKNKQEKDADAAQKFAKAGRVLSDVAVGSYALGGIGVLCAIAPCTRFLDDK